MNYVDQKMFEGIKNAVEIELGGEKHGYRNIMSKKEKKVIELVDERYQSDSRGYFNN